MVSSLSSGSSRRTRALSNGSPVASCLVDGCISDLSKCKEYHRRHKVCEVHAKTAIVMVGGREQRFCQQCSRFHLLVEFDEVKRSCRKRLEGHNRRRRKPQLRSLNYGTFMTNHQGTRFTSYPQIFSTTTAKSNWSAIIKAEEVPFNGRHNYDHFPVSSRGIYKYGKRFPFLQENVQPVPATAYQHSNNKLFDSDRAPSLLSSLEAHSSRANLRQDAVAGDRIPIGEPLILGRHYASQAYNNVSPTGFLYSGTEHEHEHVGAVLIPDGYNADFQFHGLFHDRGEGSSDGGNSRTLSFSWQ